jgi:DNA-binding transcriptional regulator YiaG
MAAVIHERAAPKKRKHTKGKRKEERVKLRARPAKEDMIGDLRHRLHLSQAVFARLLPVSVRSLASLEGGSSPTDGVTRRLIELRRLTNALTEVMKRESLGKWLETPNEAFDGLKPLEVIERGESDRIWSMVYFLRSGVPL